jgi:hypothetical protein
MMDCFVVDAHRNDGKLAPLLQNPVRQGEIECSQALNHGEYAVIRLLPQAAE